MTHLRQHKSSIPPSIFLLPLAFAPLLAGCSSSSGSGDAIQHVVVVWLKNPGDDQARQSLIDQSQKLRQIPGVMDVSAGRPLPSTRPAVEKTYDLALIVKFADEPSLRAYDQHPIHQQIARDYLEPLVRQITVYDFRGK